MGLEDKNTQKTGSKLVVFEDKKSAVPFITVNGISRLLILFEYWPVLQTLVVIGQKLKKQLIDNEGFVQLLGKIEQLKLESSDGKKYLTDTANTETIFRIVQSIPSPKAEPFKRWLASVGYERVQEIENPELATQRTRAIYKAKGYSDEWIEKRMRGIAIREELTDEWDKRGIKIQREYAILTTEISKATFGMTPSEYKKHKGLQLKHGL